MGCNHDEIQVSRNMSNGILYLSCCCGINIKAADALTMIAVATIKLKEFEQQLLAANKRIAKLEKELAGNSWPSIIIGDRHEMGG